MFKILKNKFFLTGIVIVILIVGYFIYKNISSKEKSFYVLTQVRKGSIEKIISGAGNIVSVDNFDIKSKVSEKIIYLPLKEGDVVKNGTLLAQLNSQTVERQLRDTKLSLENQLNNLEKLKLNKINLENNLEKLESEYQNLKTNNDLRKNYENNINILNDFYSNIPEIIKNVDDILFNKDFKDSPFNSNLEYYLNYFDKNYLEESQKIKNNLNDLKDKLTNISNDFYKLNIKDNEINTKIIQESYNFIIDFQSIIKSVLDVILKIKEDINLKKANHIYADLINSHLNSLKNYYDGLNNYSQSLLIFINQTNSLENNLNQILIDIENTKLNIKQLETDIKNLEIDIDRTRNKINDLQNDLEDYKIYSPINGIINSLNFKKGDVVPSGAILMNIVSSDKIAEITLNEVDVAEIRVGNDVILTLDALPNLQLKGKVIYIDPIGEVSQGVVSYKVKIAFENNPQIKIGMTVNADIITQTKRNVLVIPNQAIKTIGNRKYVEIPDEKDLVALNQRNNTFNLKNNTTNQQTRQAERTINIALNYPPQVKFIKIGLSDSKNTEVLEGLDDGDWIIVRSPANNQTISNNQQQGLFQRLFPQPRRFIRSPGLRQ